MAGKKQFELVEDLGPDNLLAINSDLDRCVETGFVRNIAEAALVGVMDDFSLSMGHNKVAVAELKMIVNGTIQAIRSRDA